MKRRDWSLAPERPQQEPDGAAGCGAKRVFDYLRTADIQEQSMVLAGRHWGGQLRSEEFLWLFAR
jgi:hypothetical protein